MREALKHDLSGKEYHTEKRYSRAFARAAPGNSSPGREDLTGATERAGTGEKFQGAYDGLYSYHMWCNFENEYGDYDETYASGFRWASYQKNFYE